MTELLEINQYQANALFIKVKDLEKEADKLNNHIITLEDKIRLIRGDNKRVFVEEYKGFDIVKVITNKNPFRGDDYFEANRLNEISRRLPFDSVASLKAWLDKQ